MMVPPAFLRGCHVSMTAFSPVMDDSGTPKGDSKDGFVFDQE